MSIVSGFHSYFVAINRWDGIVEDSFIYNRKLLNSFAFGPFPSPNTLDRITIFLNYRDITKNILLGHATHVKRIKFPTYLHGLLTQNPFTCPKCLGTCCSFYYIDYALNFGHKVHLQCSSHLIVLCLAYILIAYVI